MRFHGLRVLSVLMTSLLYAGAADAQPAPTPPELAKLRFVPVTPCRAEDTRRLAPTFLPAPGPFTLEIELRGKCGIPDNARVFSLNVTAVPLPRLDYLTVWPTGEPRPATSILNAPNGGPVASAMIVRAGIGGTVSAFGSDPSFLIVDVNGYFVDSREALAFFPLKPCRVIDSRRIASVVPWFAGGQSKRVEVSGVCGVPSTARAYSLNVTAIADGPLGHLTLYPSGLARPNVSTLNAPKGGTIVNAAITPAGAGGAIDVYVSDTVEVAIDVNGYFAEPGGDSSDGGLSLQILTPCRVVDTRPGQGTSGALGPPSIAAGDTRHLDLREGRCYVPPRLITLKPELLVYVAHATVVPRRRLEGLHLWPFESVRPEVPTLSAPTGAGPVANMAFVQGGTSDKLSAFATDETDLIVDLDGWFAP